MRDAHQVVRVLLVDDSLTFLEATTRFLRGHPALAVTGRALSGKEAMEQLAQTQPDLVLMDVAMPGISGLETTRRIKAMPRAPRVVLMTMSDEPEYQAVAAEVGADGFLTKSHCRAQLLPLIYALFSLP